MITSSLSGCGIGDMLALDEDLHIKFNYLDEDRQRLEYKGNIYYLSPIRFLTGYRGAYEDDRYQYLGWVGARIKTTLHVVAGSNGPPIFIYFADPSRGRIYFREDYDYLTDDFLIEGTDDIIRFCDDMLYADESKADLTYTNNYDVVISSVTYPGLHAKLNVAKDHTGWYAITWNFVPFKLSDNFVNILIENQLIEP
jgi:hypothetical protein